jgi:hypothetical protein
MGSIRTFALLATVLCHEGHDHDHDGESSSVAVQPSPTKTLPVITGQPAKASTTATIQVTTAPSNVVSSASMESITALVLLSLLF